MPPSSISTVHRIHLSSATGTTNLLPNRHRRRRNNLHILVTYRKTPPTCNLVSVSNQTCATPTPASASALAEAIIRASSSSPVEFVHKFGEGGESNDNSVVLPSPDFHRLCVEQLDLFRMVVYHHAVLSVYVRPAGNRRFDADLLIEDRWISSPDFFPFLYYCSGCQEVEDATVARGSDPGVKIRINPEEVNSYVMDQLELKRVAFYPGVDAEETTESVIVVANFGVPAGLRAAEAALTSKQIGILPEYGAVVLPMVKHPFVVGFLVAEIPNREMEVTCNDQNDRPLSTLSSPLPSLDKIVSEIQTFENGLDVYHQLTTDERSRAVTIARSLAMVYVMDQRAMLHQQSSWQNNVRMSHLIEQIRSPLSNIRTLSKMLTVHIKRSEDILVQGDQMKDTLRQLQDAVHFTKANIIRCNEEILKKIRDSSYGHPEILRSLLTDNHSVGGQDTIKNMDSLLPLSFSGKDMEIPMPPLALAPQQQNVRPCNVSELLEDLVQAATPLAHKQKRLLEFQERSLPTEVAVEETALRQALSNLIEGSLVRTNVGGRVQIVATGAPAGGALIIIDDDGPDMHYMTQTHYLTPFGDLYLDGKIEDNMTWNFVAGLTVSREILESYGCVVRVKSPRVPDAALGSGGTRIELWLPTLGSELEPSAAA